MSEMIFFFFLKKIAGSEFATFITNAVLGVKNIYFLTYILQLLFFYLEVWCQIGKMFLLLVL